MNLRQKRQGFIQLRSVWVNIPLYFLFLIRRSLKYYAHYTHNIDIVYKVQVNLQRTQISIFRLLNVTDSTTRLKSIIRDIQKSMMNGGLVLSWLKGELVVFRHVLYPAACRLRIGQHYFVTECEEE